MRWWNHVIAARRLPIPLQSFVVLAAPFCCLRRHQGCSTYALHCLHLSHLKESEGPFCVGVIISQRIVHPRHAVGCQWFPVGVQPRPRVGKGKDPLEGYGEDVRAAAAAVEAAEAALPRQDELGITVMEAPTDGGFGGSKPPDDPPNAGKKVRESTHYPAFAH